MKRTLAILLVKWSSARRSMRILWKLDQKNGEGLATAGKIMDNKIDAFMVKYRWAFPVSNEQVVGKLSAYFKWKKSIEGQNQGNGGKK